MSRGRRLAAPGRQRTKVYPTRVQNLVLAAFNDVQRVYRVVCGGRGTTDVLAKTDAAIGALQRARSRMILDGFDAWHERAKPTPVFLLPRDEDET